MICALLLIPFLAFAGVVQDDVSGAEKASYSFKTVCQKMVTHEAALIEAVSGTEIDCMGKRVQASSFCEKELASDPYYLRGFVQGDQVVCESGKKVIFKYQCTRLTDRQFCQANPLASCQQIGMKLARRLDLVHSSFTKSSVGIRELNCYFESLPLAEKKYGSL